MILSKKITVTEKYKGESKFPFWSNISIGDVLEVSTPIKKIRRHSYGSYAPGINIVNLTNESKFNTTMSMEARYLNNIQYTES